MGRHGSCIGARYTPKFHQSGGIGCRALAHTHQHAIARPALIAPVPQHRGTHTEGSDVDLDVEHLMSVSSAFIAALTLSAPQLLLHQPPIQSGSSAVDWTVPAEPRSRGSRPWHAVVAPAWDDSSDLDNAPVTQQFSSRWDHAGLWGSITAGSALSEAAHADQHTSTTHSDSYIRAPAIQATPSAALQPPDTATMRHAASPMQQPPPRANTDPPQPAAASSHSQAAGPATPTARAAAADVAQHEDMPAFQSGWHSPILLSPSQLVSSVYALATAGHVPSTAWMQECLTASERIFNQQGSQTSPVTPVAGRRQATLASFVTDRQPQAASAPEHDPGQGSASRHRDPAATAPHSQQQIVSISQNQSAPADTPASQVRYLSNMVSFRQPSTRGNQSSLAPVADSLSQPAAASLSQQATASPCQQATASLSQSATASLSQSATGSRAPGAEYDMLPTTRPDMMMPGLSVSSLHHHVNSPQPVDQPHVQLDQPYLLLGLPPPLSQQQLSNLPLQPHPEQQLRPQLGNGQQWQASTSPHQQQQQQQLGDSLQQQQQQQQPSGDCTLLLDEAQLFTLAWGIARLHQLQWQQHRQAPATPAAAKGQGTSSRFSSVLSQLSSEPHHALCASDAAWPRPSLSWLRALERGSLAVALGTDTKAAPYGGPRDASAGGGRPRGIKVNGRQRTAYGALRQGTPRLYATVPWCMAVLGLLPSHTWLETWTSAMQPVMSRLGGQDVAQVAWAVARFAYRPPEAWVRCLVARGEQLAVERQLEPQDLAMLLCACARVRFDCGASFVTEALSPRVLTSSPRLKGRFSPRDVAHVLWALATLQQRPPPATLHTLLTEAQPHMRHMNEQDLVQMVWALARLRYNPSPAIRDALLRSLTLRVMQRDFTPRGLPPLLWALARLPWYVPPGLAMRFMDVAACMAGRLPPAGVAMVLTFAATQPHVTHTRHYSALLNATLIPSATDGVMTEAAATASTTLPDAAADTAMTAEASDCDPACRIRPSVSARVGEGPSVWSGCSCRTAAMTLRTLASCGVRPHREWMWQFFDGTMQTLPGASPGDICTLTSALSSLSYTPPRAWRDCMAQRVQQLHAEGQLLPAQESRLARFAGLAQTGRKAKAIRAA